MSEPTTEPNNEPAPHPPLPDHHYCRHLKMDGVRCRNQIPLGHIHCYHHRYNRNPAFVRHNGKVRIPLLEDVSALQVTTTATVHALVNNSLDRRDARVILTAVKAATSALRLDLAERRWLRQTGQSRPEPVIDFAVMGHEHVAVEDPIPAAAEEVTCTHPSSLDPEDDFLTPATFVPFDAEMRIPPAAPGAHDELGPDWPCPYRFNYCQGPGPKASCHYCTGALRWEDVHPNEPDPGAPGPLPTVNLDWTIADHRDISAPTVILSEPSKPVARRFAQQQINCESNGPAFPPANHDPLAAGIPTSPNKKETPVILSEPSKSVAQRFAQQPISRESNGPAFLPAIASGQRALPEILPPANPYSECEPEWIYDTAPRPQSDAEFESEIAVLVASADPATGCSRHYQCAPTESATSQNDPPDFDIHFPPQTSHHGDELPR
jgi:hypothetical protein